VNWFPSSDAKVRTFRLNRIIYWAKETGVSPPSFEYRNIPSFRNIILCLGYRTKFENYFITIQFWCWRSVKTPQINTVHILQITWWSNTQGIHKRMVRFKKLTRNLFLTLQGCNVNSQQNNCPSFVHCNHRYGHLKTEHTESLVLLRRHLGNWPRSKHKKRTADSAWETWTVAAVDGVPCARVRWEINFLLTFETAPFFCVYSVFKL